MATWQAARVNKRVEQGQATRRELLDVAIELFAERGYADTPIEAVLEASSVSRGSLYYHFKSKDLLFDAALEDVESRVATELVRAAKGKSDPLEALREGCVAFLRMAREPAVRQIVLIDAPSVVGWERWREIDDRYAFGIMRAAVHALSSRLRAPCPDAMLAHIVLASLLELAMVVARADKPRAALKEAETAFDALLYSLWDG